MQIEIQDVYNKGKALAGTPTQAHRGRQQQQKCINTEEVEKEKM